MQKWLTDHMVQRIQSKRCVNYVLIISNPPIYKGSVEHAGKWPKYLSCISNVSTVCYTNLCKLLPSFSFVFRYLSCISYHIRALTY